MLQLKKLQIDSYLTGMWERGMKPYLAVATKYPGVIIPEEYYDRDIITLNLGTSAIRDFTAGDTAIEYSATFDGRGVYLNIPYEAMYAMYPSDNPEMITTYPLNLPGTLPEPEVDESKPNSNWARSARVISG